ncbi:MAG: hypothetical protein SFX19_08775 [Alphaproteobacteria bacterium]|nr:hypothetical protein [Alphaproteobacteria bacterium]
MAMSAGQGGISLSDLQSQLAAGQAASAGGEEEQSDFADFITKAIAGRVGMVARLSGGLLPNMNDPENAAPTKMFDSQGPLDKKIQGLAVMATNQGNFIWRALKMVFSNRNITDMAAGVGGGGEGGAMGSLGDFIASLGDSGMSLGSFVESFAPSIPIESLGSISPQTFASAAPMRGMDMDIG